MKPETYLFHILDSRYSHLGKRMLLQGLKRVSNYLLRGSIGTRFSGKLHYEEVEKTWKSMTQEIL